MGLRPPFGDASPAPAVTRLTPDSPLRRPATLLRQMAGDVRRALPLARELCARDLRTHYRQSLMGYFWAVLPPLATSGAFIFLNQQQLLTAENIGAPYPVYVLTGLFFWQFFVEMLQCPLKAVGSARSLLTKVSFPREALLLSGVGEVLFNTFVRVLVTVPLLAWAGAPWPSSLLLALAGWLALGLLGFGLGLVLAPFGMLYGDIGRGIGLLTTFWFFVTPVVYAPGRHGLGAVLAAWNPVSPLLQTARAGLLAPTNAGAAFWSIAAVAVLLSIAAWVFFRVALPRIVERLGG